MNRREFLKKTSALAGAGALSAWSTLPAGCRTRAAEVNYPAYENNLRDRLWMWGHDPGQIDGPKGVYKLPQGDPMSMAEGCQSMGIPNVCVIRYGTPDEEYRKQFKEVKRVAWNLGCSNATYHSLKKYVFGLRDTMPNLTGYYFDDFFLDFGSKPGFDMDSETAPAPAALSLDEMKQLQAETLAYQRRLDLTVVLYTHQLSPAIKPYMKYVDAVSLWTWSGSDIQKIDANFRRYRSLVPDKPTHLGIYMWDFAEKKELGTAYMAKQLDYAFRLYQEGQIEGMIFLCTSICNKGLAAVDYARKWIAEHGNEGCG